MRRGLDDIFDPALRESIAALIDDVRQRGDAAVCDALATFDGIEVTPHQLAVSAEEFERAAVSPAVDAALDDAIAHLRCVQRGPDAPGRRIGRSTANPVSASARRSRRSPPPGSSPRRAKRATRASRTSSRSLPSSPAYRRSHSSFHRSRADPVRSTPPCSSCAASSGSSGVPRQRSRRHRRARIRDRDHPSCRKIVGPGSPAVTLAQVEMQRHGVATMMLLGPTESLVIADDAADPIAARCRPADRGRTRHGQHGRAPHASPALADAVDRGADGPACDAARGARAGRRSSLGPNGGCVIVGLAGHRRHDRQRIRTRTPPGRRRRRTPCDGVIDGLINAGEILVGQHTPFSAANFVIGCPASLPTSGFAHVSSGITADTFLKRTAIARADADRTEPDDTVDPRVGRPRGLPRARRCRPPPPASACVTLLLDRPDDPATQTGT